MAMTARYTVIEGDIISQTRGATRRDYVPDANGNTVALTNDSSTVTDTFTYWPYGEVKARTGSTPTPFQFGGSVGYYQDAGNRTYVRARHLQTSMGRWMSTDPSTKMTLGTYEYADSNPVSNFDPSGEQTVSGAWVRNRVIEHFRDCFGAVGMFSSIAYRKILNQYACVFDCLVQGESSYRPRVTAQGTYSTAYGLTQLSRTQFENCAPEGCKDITDPKCNLVAALNLFIETCNLGTFLGQRDGVPGPHFIIDPLSTLRRSWEACRASKPSFEACITACGLTLSEIRALPCPPKKKGCGCKESLGPGTVFR